MVYGFVRTSGTLHTDHSAPGQALPKCSDQKGWWVLPSLKLVAGSKTGNGAAGRTVLHRLWPEVSARTEQQLLSGLCWAHLPSGRALPGKWTSTCLFSPMAQLPLPALHKMPKSFLDPRAHQPPEQSRCQVVAEPAAGQRRQRTKQSDLAAWRPGLVLAKQPLTPPLLPLGKSDTNGEQEARAGTSLPPAAHPEHGGWHTMGSWGES